ncbi:hypothetical protein Salat_0733300 [Sesamum alatum]|uniref:Uncharacterized protein n=1 Tax=Sesamum alatum TaxID=300844 RepID=A0AAE1YTC3_9LAMI|nr:hypothetical protein Salat_0733300 [Sesamum alatum]
MAHNLQLFVAASENRTLPVCRNAAFFRNQKLRLPKSDSRLHSHSQSRLTASSRSSSANLSQSPTRLCRVLRPFIARNLGIRILVDRVGLSGVRALCNRWAIGVWGQTPPTSRIG